MLGNLMLPKSPGNRRQGALDPHYRVQHQAPVCSQQKILDTMTRIPTDRLIDLHESAFK